jgi:cytochrome b561
VERWPTDRVLDWFAIPGPFGELPALREASETVHGVASRLMIPLIGLHVLGALKHALFDRAVLRGRILGRSAATGPGV